MSTNPAIPRALRRIADASRKFNRTEPTTSNVPSILKSLPEHRPLLPLLLSHGIPSRLAKTCADRYDRCANELRSESETKLTPYLINRRKNPPAVVYPLFLSNYTHVLRDWAQSILNTALKCLKRDSVDLSDWNVTYPAPLWLPFPPDAHPKFTYTKSKNIRPLSSTSTPPHAFPTTYPPPLRPSRELSTIEWPRAPSTSLYSSTISPIDIDALCARFTGSLVIDENSKWPSQRKTSIFSLPVHSKEEYSSTHHRAKLPRRNPSQNQTAQKLSTNQPSPTTLPKTGKPHQMSLPPSFPSPPHNTRRKSRKVSTPASCPPLHRTPTSSPGFLRPPSRKTSPQSVSPTDSLGLNHFAGPYATHSGHLQPAPDLKTHTHQYSPSSSAGPITPPTSSLKLFSEPAVVSSASADVLRGVLTDPFTQFQLELDAFSKVPAMSHLDYSASMPGLATDDFSPITPCGFSPNHGWPLSGLVPPTSPLSFAYDSFVAQVGS